MQSVLFTWLVVGELHARPELVGTAQMAMLIPNLFLLLVGGATADRWDRRRVLKRMHALGAVFVAGLALAVGTGRFSFSLLLAYALCIGTLVSFVLPARDALLSEVAGNNMMRAVTGMTVAGFTLQALGALAGGSGRWIGSAAALGCQAALLLIGVVPYWIMERTAPAVAHPVAHPPLRRTLHGIREGLCEVWGSERLRLPVLLASANAVLFFGPYIVVVPLLVRDFYHGDVGDLGLVNMMFPVGTITGSLLLLLRGGIRRKGLATLLALSAGGLCLLSLAFGLPFWGLLVAILVWGICASVFFNATRTLVQQAAPATHRARVLSVYSLGLFGGGPVGALQAGFAAERIGPFATCALSGVAMLIVIAAVTAVSRFDRVE